MQRTLTQMGTGLATLMVASAVAAPSFAGSVFDFSTTGSVAGGVYTASQGGIDLTVTSAFGQVVQTSQGLGVDSAMDFGDDALDGNLFPESLNFNFSAPVSVLAITFAAVDEHDDANLSTFLDGVLATFSTLDLGADASIEFLPGDVYGNSLTISALSLEKIGEKKFFGMKLPIFDADDFYVSSIEVDNYAQSDVGSPVAAPAPAAAGIGLPALLALGLRRRRQA